jgi:hypothetical protein
MQFQLVIQHHAQYYTLYHISSALIYDWLLNLASDLPVTAFDRCTGAVCSSAV